METKVKEDRDRYKDKGKQEARIKKSNKKGQEKFGKKIKSLKEYQNQEHKKQATYTIKMLKTCKKHTFESKCRERKSMARYQTCRRRRIANGRSTRGKRKN